MKLVINNELIYPKHIRNNSKKVSKGDLFIAYKGINNDGNDYIAEAIENGARYVIGERKIYELQNILKKHSHIKYIHVNDSRECWAELCAQRYNYPQHKLKIIGITGTDGKTTTTHLIYEILKFSNMKVGLINTVSAKVGKKEIKTGDHTTTPDPDILFNLINKIVDQGIEYLVLEVTSHSLNQKRVHGIDFEVSGVTNITPEHLDLHKNFDSYVKDKAKISFQSHAVFLNKESLGYEELKKYLPKRLLSKNRYFEISSKSKIIREDIPPVFKKKFPGEYNTQNVMLAINICQYLGVSYELCIGALENVSPVKGRFNKIKNNLGINLVVDFAHTPNSMKNILSTVSNMKKGDSKIITVFGCAGERDTHKRKIMGEISAKYSDFVVLTSEDPRSESAVDITNQIIGESRFSYIVEINRKKAIKKAIKIAKEDDWVLILGKGHEESMDFGKGDCQWSDIKVVNDILNR